MGTNDAGNSQRSVSTEELLAGFDVTEEGKARAKAELDAAQASYTPERRASARAQLGLPPAEAA